MNERLKNESSLKGKEKQEYINMLWLFSEDNKNNLLNEYKIEYTKLYSDKPDVEPNLLQDEVMKSIYINYKASKNEKKN